MLARFIWVLRRLSVMTRAEIGHRLRQQSLLLAMLISYLGNGRKKVKVVDPAAYGFCAAINHQLPELPWDRTFDADEQRALLTGKWHALGFEWAWKPDPMVWHTAPDTKRLWPKRFFATIPFRESNPYGDIRVAWEPARLQQLISLALLAQNSDSPATHQETAKLLERQFHSWVDANPPYEGIHYISAMECALRLIAVLYAMDMIRVHLAETSRTWSRVVELVMVHAGFIARRLSLHSSTGNHTIAEAAGLLHAGLCFSELEDAERWSSLGLSILERQAGRQILPDGGGFEQAFYYHAFVMDLFGLSIRLLESRNLTVPEVMARAWQRGMNFVEEFTKKHSTLPLIGDSDGGWALSPRLRLCLRSGTSPASLKPALVGFIHSGYSIIVDPEAGPLSVVFDHGLLGMPPSYGHGHADALQVLVSIAGHELLIDPGTYTYTGEPEWRRYFRGTRAHNTVVVDELDQAEQTTSFMWAKPYNTALIHHHGNADATVRLLAWHNGYGRLGVEHWRGVAYTRGILVVWDRLLGDGFHKFEINWHCAGSLVSSDAAQVSVSDGSVALKLRILGGELSLHSGETAPILGWRSPLYGSRQPITTISSRAQSSLPYEFTTIISLTPNTENEKVRREVDHLRSLLP